MFSLLMAFLILPPVSFSPQITPEFAKYGVSANSTAVVSPDAPSTGLIAPVSLDIPQAAKDLTSSASGPEAKLVMPLMAPTVRSSAMLPVAPMTVSVLPAPGTKRLGELQPHRFWDRENLIGFSVHSATRIADAAQTCVLLGRPGRREAWLPTQSCAGVTAYSLAMIPAQLGSSYLLHRKGYHTMERWTPYLWAAPSAVGIGLSFKAW